MAISRNYISDDAIDNVDNYVKEGESEKEKEIIYKANEVLDGMDMSDEMKDAVRESTIKHDNIYKGLVDR